ncbi:MAG: hypothetical protein IPF73_12720 [Betaproteobacteria bacterium]|nr:hypothetical protein [Betaproteobacteria bacterium]
MRFHRTVHAVLVSALTLCAFATGSVSRAAEFLYDNGVIFNGATSASLQIIDVLPAQKVGGDPTTFESRRRRLQRLRPVVLEPGTPSSE